MHVDDDRVSETETLEREHTERVWRRFNEVFRLEYSDDGNRFTIIDRKTGQVVGVGAQLPWQEREIVWAGGDE